MNQRRKQKKCVNTQHFLRYYNKYVGRKYVSLYDSLTLNFNKQIILISSENYVVRFIHQQGAS